MWNADSCRALLLTDGCVDGATVEDRVPEAPHVVLLRGDAMFVVFIQGFLEYEHLFHSPALPVIIIIGQHWVPR